MIPSSLLQDAKQGDPEAISTLMHLALESRGVTVQAVRIQNYLYISFISDRQLNQTTLVSFSRKGLEKLGVKSIQTVKVYGLKTGEELPLWTAEFRLGEAAAIEASSAADSSVGAGAIGLFPAVMLPPQLVRFQRSAFRCWQRLQTQLQPRSHWFEQVKIYRRQLPIDLTFGPPQYIIMTIVTLMAFVFGGVLALIANSRPDRLPSGEMLGEDASADPQQTIAMQQEDAKRYLQQMNQAQQNFYQANGRFAKIWRSWSDRCLRTLKLQPPSVF